ncbi:SMC1 family ATPase [Marseillevirus marseillevirus]|uniref:SMC1 family ATPase n=1 Tax=Marseillevirus marseillevirus TaxID=694581 RepID=D2XAC6_GBMV|nr:SMC1 family ATPase [Marseillevirus marseillevirus]ADB03903.1 SMC1 family ATPase [Marseillevirus marseillevirus]
MEVSLRNFRCFKEKDVAFPEKGLVLLSAPSGTGKSTVLNAFFWALYGELKKPQSFGSRSCSVSVSLPEKYGISIRRQSGPGRLVVLDHKNKDSEYEGEVAQETINSRILNSREFMASCYVVQNLDNSILSLTPGEQLSFVENLSLDKEAIEKERLNLKKYISRIEEERVELATKEKCFSQSLSEFDGLKEPSEPFVEISEGKISELERKAENIKKSALKCQERILELEKNTEISLSIGKLEGEKKCLEETIGDPIDKSTLTLLTKKRDDARKFALLNSRKIEREKYERELSSFLKDIEEKKASSLSEKRRRELQERKETLEAQKESYLSFIKRKEAVDKTLASIYSQVKKEFPTRISPSVSSYSKHLGKNIDALTDKEKRLSSKVEVLIERKARAELESAVLICPCCSEGLKFVDGSLQKSEHKNTGIDGAEVKRLSSEKTKKLKETKEKLSKAKSLLEKLSGCVLTESSPKFESQEELDEIRQQLKKHVPVDENIPSWLLKMECEKLTEEEAKFLEEDTGTLEERQRELDRAKDHIVRQKKLEKQLKDIRKRISLLKERREENFSEELSEQRKKLSDLREELSETEKELQGTKDLRLNVLRWEAYNEKVKRRDEILQKIKHTQEQANQNQKNSVDAFLLKEKSRSATFLAVEKTLAAINAAAKHHLDKLFVEDPISITLKTTKETKAGKKTQMCTSIFYKGHEYDGFLSLSGGERQKACLSFILAINEVVGANFLFLDEALAQLHKEVNTEIIEYLRDEIAVSRLVVVVSHEASRGLFHKIIEL